MQALAKPQRNGAEVPEYAARSAVVDQMLADLIARFSGHEFEFVHPARWRHKDTGHHVETSFTHGEAKVRVFLDGGRKEDVVHVLTGRADDLDAFHRMFPVTDLPF